MSEPVKRKVGRPSKGPVHPVIPRLGIVAEPSNLRRVEDPRLVNVFEILYDNPTMFKKIFNLFKALSVENIMWRLEEKYIKLYTRDHVKANQIYVKILGNKMNRYYLEHPLEFSLGLASVQKIFQTLNKNISKILFSTSRQYERSKIKIALTDESIEKDNIYTIDVKPMEEYDWKVEEELSLEEYYPLKFEIPSKQFKKEVNDCHLLSDIMKIEKYGEGPLQFNLNFKTKDGKGDGYFKNPGRLNLIALVDPGEIFSTSVYIEYIKPIAGAQISETIEISAAVGQKIIFTARLDQINSPKTKSPGAEFPKVPGSEKCIIKILTNIVKADRTVSD